MQKIFKHFAAICGILIITLLAAYFLDLVAASSRTLLLFLVAVLLIMEFQCLRFLWNPKLFDQIYHRQKWQEYKRLAGRRRLIAPDFDPESGAMLPPKELTFTPARWDESLTQLWEGSEDLGFTYVRRNGIKKICAITATAVLVGEDKCFYVRGICRACQEPRTYNADSIQGRVSCGGKPQEIYDFFLERLGISEAEVFFLKAEQ